MRFVHTALIVLFVAALLIFCFQNLEKVSITFLAWEVVIPLPMLIPIVYFLGMFTGWSIISFVRRSIKGARAKAE